MIRTFGLLGLLALALIVPASAQAPVARAPLSLFYGYDFFRSPDISPNGRYVAVVRHDPVGDVLTVLDLETQHVASIQVARADQHMEISGVTFKGDDRVIFTLEQKIHVVPGTGTAVRTDIIDDGFEWTSRVYASNIDGTGLVALYDPSGQQGFPRDFSAGLVSVLPHDDDHILLIVPNFGGNELWKVNVHDGSHTMVERGFIHTLTWIVDVNGAPVLREDEVSNFRGFAWLRRGPGQTAWTEIVRFRGADAANSGPTFQGVGPAVQAGQVFVYARRDGEDTSGLYVLDTTTGRYVETVASNPDFDVSGAIRDTDNNTILAGCWWAQKWTCQPRDPTFARHWNALNRALGDQVNVEVLARGGPANNRWIVHTNGPQDLGTYYLYDVDNRSLRSLFGSRPEIDPALLPTERIVEYTASDGQHLWGYLWIPPGVTNATHLPTVVVPHGGPEGRDVWGFDPFAIVLASQGYAVFQPNFRGGGGSGRHFVQAGWGQWGQRMQEDVADGARNLIQQGIIDPNRLCIMGWSYGGYVAFTASFENADLYKCSVAGAGIADLSEMQRWERDGNVDRDVIAGGGSGSQSISYKYWRDAIGEDRTVMNAHSAAHNAQRVGMPLLMIHGDEDQTVPIEQSQIMQRAMQHAGKPVRLVVLRDTEHHYTPDQGDAWHTVFTESLGFIGQNIGPGVPPGSQ